ncbi:MAG TPA: winged helix-turn-helix domain-containing protein [Vicinamibacterales bacterium]|jgi:TolB-like protein
MRIGAFELDVQARELHDGATRIRLQTQPFEILRALLERPGDVVTRDELRRRLWPNGIFVDFEHSLNTAIKRLRAALGDNAERPTFVETVPRCGYRYIAAGHNPRSPSRVRLVVLPFNAVSDTLQCEHFSEGLTEEVIVQLSAASDEVDVIAPWSSRFDRRNLARARDIGESVHAGFLLEGSTRIDGARARIIARLVEAATEVHLWSETYDRFVECPMSVQADVGSAVARGITKELLS